MNHKDIRIKYIHFYKNKLAKKEIALSGIQGLIEASDDIACDETLTYLTDEYDKLISDINEIRVIIRSLEFTNFYFTF